jgi:disulfide bond formation protein DsbB
MRRRSRRRERLTALAFALFLVAAIVGAAFAFGYILGKALL